MAGRGKQSNRIFVIEGKDTSLVDAECDRLLDELISAEDRTTGLVKLDAAEAVAADVLDELRTIPFLTDKRVVVLKNADKFISANREVLERYFDNPSPTGVLVMTVATWDGRTRLARKLRSVGRLITASCPNEQALVRRLAQYCESAHGKKITPQAAQLLVELAGNEPVRLYGEIDKLAVYSGNAETITITHVEALVGRNRLFDAFKVIDATIAGDAASAVARLRNMFAGDKSAEYKVVGAFAYHVRRLFEAKVMLGDGVPAKQITEKFRIWSGADDFISQVRVMPLSRIGRTMELLAEVDYKIKTGRTTAPVAIEQLVLQLASA